MGERFGEHLRTQRIARGLTQAGLGGTAYSTSYISLIEAGRREPGPDVVRQLAAKLQLSPMEPQSRSEDARAGGTAYLISAQAASQAWDLREYGRAAAHSDDAARAAAEAGKGGAWWAAQYLRCECLLKLKRFARDADIARRLLAHPIADDALAARAHTVLSHANTGLGDPATAVGHGREAVRHASRLEGRAEILLESLRTLIAAFADGDRLEEAWDYCGLLSDLGEADPAGQLRGGIEWTIGNVAFARADHAESEERHLRAARLLSPADDLELWARFNKSAAAARLDGGNLEPETLDTLRRAELAYSVIHATPVDQLELTLPAARWLRMTGSTTESISLLQAVHRDADLLGPRFAARAESLLARALDQPGEPDRAGVPVRGSARARGQAGSTRGASRRTQSRIAEVQVKVEENQPRGQS